LRASGHSLDQVMRGLWKRCAGGPMREQDVQDELHALTGEDWHARLHGWVHQANELPLKELLTANGVKIIEDTPAWAQRLGLRVTETHGIQIKTVLHGGIAQQAGLCAGDQWLGIELPASRGRQACAWRLMRLDELPLYAGSAQRLTALIERDRQLLRLPVDLRGLSQETTWRLSISDEKRVQAWLQG
jgi:predicted metalloprotease with PDZ domain